MRCPSLPCSQLLFLCFYLTSRCGSSPISSFLSGLRGSETVGLGPQGCGNWRERVREAATASSEQLKVLAFLSETAEGGWVLLHHCCEMHVNGSSARLHIWWEGKPVCLAAPGPAANRRALVLVVVLAPAAVFLFFFSEEK